MSVVLYLICCRKLHFVLVALTQEMAQTLKKKKQLLHELSEGSTVDGEMAKQAGRRQAG